MEANREWMKLSGGKNHGFDLEWQVLQSKTINSHNVPSPTNLIHTLGKNSSYEGRMEQEKYKADRNCLSCVCKS